MICTILICNNGDIIDEILSESLPPEFLRVPESRPAGGTSWSMGEGFQPHTITYRVFRRYHKVEDCKLRVVYIEEPRKESHD